MWALDRCQPGRIEEGGWKVGGHVVGWVIGVGGNLVKSKERSAERVGLYR